MCPWLVKTVKLFFVTVVSLYNLFQLINSLLCCCLCLFLFSMHPGGSDSVDTETDPPRDEQNVQVWLKTTGKFPAGPQPVSMYIYYSHWEWPLNDNTYEKCWEDWPWLSLFQGFRAAVFPFYSLSFYPKLMIYLSLSLLIQVSADSNRGPLQRPLHPLSRRGQRHIVWAHALPGVRWVPRPSLQGQCHRVVFQNICM